MDIAQLLQTLIATIVGGCIVIGTNWISVQGERRRTTQDWYEQTYITNGIDPLIIYFQGVELHLFDKLVGSFMQLPNLEPPLIEALVRVDILLNDDVVSRITYLVQSTLNNTKESTEAGRVAAREARLHLTELRQKLLTIITKNVRDKRYKAKVPHVLEQLNVLADLFFKEIERLEKNDLAAG